jgi:hypothetical protein
MKFVCLFAAALGLAVPQARGQAQVEREVLQTLENARRRFTADDAERRNRVLAALDALVTEETPDEFAARVEADRAAFVEHGVLPASTADVARNYATESSKAIESLWRAFERAEGELSKAAFHERASTLATERELLRARYERRDWRDVRLDATLGPKSGARWNGPSVEFDSDGEGSAVLEAPRGPKGSGYRLELEVQRTSGNGGVKLYFVRPDLEKRPLGLLILGGVDGRTSGLEQIGGASIKDNPTTHKGEVLPVGKTNTIVLEATATRISVAVNGKRILNFDELDRLTLDPVIAKQFKQDGKSIHVVIPAGTTARLESAFASVLDAPKALEAKPKPPKEKKVVAPAEDRLSQGRRFDAKWWNDSGCTVVVSQRNRSARSASLQVTGAKGNVYVFRVETNETGSTFKIVSVVQTAVAPRDGIGAVVVERGQGHVDRSGDLKMDWKATRNRISWSTKLASK